MGILDDIRNGLLKAASSALTSSDDDDDISYEQMRDALVKSGLAEPTEETPRGLFHDPYSVYDWGGWRERPSALTYETLRMMAARNTVIAAIIQVRVNQISQFARPQQGRYDKGFRIALRDRRDRKRVMTPEEQHQATEIERMLETTGFLLPDEKPADRASFRDFLKMATRDILIYDQWCFEKIRDRKGRLSRFIALPSETIRPAVMDIEHLNPAELRSRVSHVQVFDDSVIAEYSPDDIAFCIMNPRSDMRTNGFGYSPVEMTMNVVTSWLFGYEYNTRFFTQGSAVKGILNVKGAIPDRQLKAFRRMWYSMVTGVQNAWRTPILNAEDIQWTSLHSTNREMEFGQWMDWLTKLISGVFAMDPSEINFQYGNTGQTSTLSQPDNEKKVVESKDRGLRPLAEHIQDQMNKHIVWDMNPDFEFIFSGLDAKSEETEREGFIKDTSAFRTIDEVRAELELDPLPDGLGEIIRDPTWLQNKQATAGAEGGEGGDEEGGMEEDDGPLDELPGAGDEDPEEEPIEPDEGEDTPPEGAPPVPQAPKPEAATPFEKALAKSSRDVLKSLASSRATLDQLQKSSVTRTAGRTTTVINIDLENRHGRTPRNQR